MNVLVLGAGGLLGNAVYRVLGEDRRFHVMGTVRSADVLPLFGPRQSVGLMVTSDLTKTGSIESLFAQVRPELVVNCVSVARGTNGGLDPLRAIEVYALLPHQLAAICGRTGARLVQISSDAVFSGQRGCYTEDDVPDARDNYGISKLLGEVSSPHITLRTSLLGHELSRPHGLLEWFLGQVGCCRCFTKAIFSGLPTVVLAQIIGDVIIPRPELAGVYHIAASPISKFEVLSLVAETYGKDITILPDSRVSINRSLVADKFRARTGYTAPKWPQLIEIMHSYQRKLEG